MLPDRMIDRNMNKNMLWLFIAVVIVAIAASFIYPGMGPAVKPDSLNDIQLSLLQNSRIVFWSGSSTALASTLKLFFILFIKFDLNSTSGYK